MRSRSSILVASVGLGRVTGLALALGRVTGLALALGCGPLPAGHVPAGYAGPSVERFVAERRSALAADIERGSGEVIYDLAIIAGCQDVAGLGRILHRK